MHKSVLTLPAIALQLCLACVAPDASAQAAVPPPAAAGHDHSSMIGHDMPSTNDTTSADHEMKSALGPYSMSREGFGTSWQPDATPMLGLYVQ